MLLSHEHNFIFIKTRKTAGTSVEIALSRAMGLMDIVTPLGAKDEATRVLEGRRPQNFHAINAVDPGFEMTDRKQAEAFAHANQKTHRLRETFYNHMTAVEVRRTIGVPMWRKYHSFCIERIPFDRLISYYYFRQTARKWVDMSFSEYIRQEDPRMGNLWMYTAPSGVIVNDIIPYHNLAPCLEQKMQELGVPFQGLDVFAKSTSRKDKRHWSEVISKADRDYISKTFEAEFEVLDMTPNEAWTFDPGA